MRDRQPFIENRDAGTLAQAIVDTVREPLLVLDKDLRVLAASRTFYSTFQVVASITQGQLLYELGDGQWDIPGLRLLLERIVPEHGVMDDYEVEHRFPEIGNRTMLLNARKVFYEGSSHTTCMGLSLSRVVHTIFSRPCLFILLFDPRREHSSVPTAYFHRRRAQRRSRTALLQRRRRLVLDGREHGGRLPAIGWLAAR
jgi:PAS domain-containing protein